MAPNHPSQPPGPEAFNGKGMFLTLQVADTAMEFERLKKAGVTIAYAIKDEPWGQRRFGLFDPAGMWVDVVEQIEPALGFGRSTCGHSSVAQQDAAGTAPPPSGA